jgi:hypothetical protein
MARETIAVDTPTDLANSSIVTGARLFLAVIYVSAYTGAIEKITFALSTVKPGLG